LGHIEEDVSDSCRHPFSCTNCDALPDGVRSHGVTYIHSDSAKFLSDEHNHNNLTDTEPDADHNDSIPEQPAIEHYHPHPYPDSVTIDRQYCRHSAAVHYTDRVVDYRKTHSIAICQPYRESAAVHYTDRVVDYRKTHSITIFQPYREYHSSPAIIIAHSARKPICGAHSGSDITADILTSNHHPDD
jgi:hypothetical protein